MSRGTLCRHERARNQLPPSVDDEQCSIDAEGRCDLRRTSTPASSDHSPLASAIEQILKTLALGRTDVPRRNHRQVHCQILCCQGRCRGEMTCDNPMIAGRVAPNRYCRLPRDQRRLSAVLLLLRNRGRSLRDNENQSSRQRERSDDPRVCGRASSRRSCGTRFADNRERYRHPWITSS